MDSINPVPKPSLRWLALLAGTFGVHLFVIAMLGFIAFQQVSVGWAGLAAIFCLPAAWSVFILWKFRGFGERVVGVLAAISSLLELSDLTRIILNVVSHS